MKANQIVSPDGTCIAYDVAGQGPYLVLLHGAGKTRKDWHTAGYVDQLKQDFTVVTLDIRGTGDSDKPLTAADYAIEKICADITAVADACGAKKFGVWGFSFGGNIARYLGAWSRRVTAIAVIGVPFGFAVDAKFDQYIAELENKWGDAVRAYNAGKLSEKERKELLKRQLPVWLPCFQAMRTWPAVEPEAVHCPVLLLVGTRNKDTLTWVESHRPTLDRAKVRVEIVEGLNHNQEFSEVEKVLPVVRPFFEHAQG